MGPLVFTTALLLLPVAVFVVLAALRRARFRALAERLGARHEGFNPLTPGAIVGDGFRVEAVKIGKAYRTEIQVRASRARGRVLLEPEFFRRAPNWPFARVFGTRTERVFFWEVELPALAQPDREQQEALLSWLPKPAELGELCADLTSAKVRAIHVEDGELSTSFRGIVSDPERIERTLGALTRLASATPTQSRPRSRAA